MLTSSQQKAPEYWFIFQNEQLLLLAHANENKLPEHSAISLLEPSFIRHYKIGVFNHVHCYCAELAPQIPLSPEFNLVPLRKAFEILGPNWFVTAAKAYSIINWDKNHHFCGRCGNITIPHSENFVRICSHCKLEMYPRISPSVIVLIKNQDKILMSRSPHFTPGAYGLIAGFVEAGESLEDAVHREVKEEVSLKIKNLRYFGSQPWPFPDSLMIGFTADYAAGEIIIDTREIETAGWYRYDNLPGRPSSMSIARKLIDHFIAEQAG